jgi:hypothetical protein
VGPHRDELALVLGGLPVKGYASHGESWSFALALRLASYALLRADGGEPVLVLDDVFAELDTGRRDRLATLVGGAEQVLVTAAVAAGRAGGAGRGAGRRARGHGDACPMRSRPGPPAEPAGAPGPQGPDLVRAALSQARAAARARGATPGTPGRRPRRPGPVRSGSGPDARDPMPFGQAIRRLVEERGWQDTTAAASVLARWDELVGPELAEHCRPASLLDGELVLVAESSAWAPSCACSPARCRRGWPRRWARASSPRSVVRGPLAAGLAQGPAPGPRPRPARHLRLTGHG